jgi:hypothetical protein
MLKKAFGTKVSAASAGSAFKTLFLGMMEKEIRSPPPNIAPDFINDLRLIF